MIGFYYCEKCDMEFVDKEKCIEHEKQCKNETFMVKAVAYIDCDIVVTIYPEVRKINDMINLYPTKLNGTWFKDSLINFDVPKRMEDGGYIVYTKDMDLQYEDKLARKLIQMQIVSMNESIKLLSDSIKDQEQKLKTGKMLITPCRTKNELFEEF